MTTGNDLIEETRALLLGTYTAENDRLAAALDADDTTVVLEIDQNRLVPSSVISIDDEIMFILTVTPGIGASVQRGFLGTTPAPHALSSLVEVNPRYSRFTIKRALRQEIHSWAPRLWTAVTVTGVVGALGRMIDLTLTTPAVSDDVLEVYRITRDPRSGSDTDIGKGFRFERGAQKIYFDQPVDVAIEAQLTIFYPIDRANAFDAGVDVATIGIPESMADIAPLGAAWRLVAGREVRRVAVEAQGEPRDATEVPVGSITTTARAMKALRDERIGDENRRLRYLYPMRKHL